MDVGCCGGHALRRGPRTEKNRNSTHQAIVSTSAAPFILAHLSDPHLTSPAGAPLRTRLNKRALGYLSWRTKRRVEHRPEVLGELVRDLLSVRPDHVVITGDLTHIGLPSEFAQAARWLERLGSSHWVTVVPGNHDAYVREPWRRSFAHWAPYIKSDSQRSLPGSDPQWFPSLRRRGPVALLGISTARPSPPFSAVGEVGEEQATALERLLEETGYQQLFRVVLMHHPPLPGTVRWRRRLTDSARLRGVLERAGAELVLHGHTHRTTIAEVTAKQRRIPVIGARSASARAAHPDRRAQYHLYRIAPDGDKWVVRVSARGIDARMSRVAEHWSASITV